MKHFNTEEAKDPYAPTFDFAVYRERISNRNAQNLLKMYLNNRREFEMRLHCQHHEMVSTSFAEAKVEYNTILHISHFVL